MITIQTNHGTIEAELYSDDAPVTVDNFLKYVSEGFYDGTIFHRVIPGFMIQGGGFETGMVSKDNGAPIPNEANNGLLNE
ncbi:MAG: peptidylprolyl isomerase, partial [Proteobacteria bacterium]|nr:peptidylprolyl isomerase [Pseudomonadota bacterium]